MTALTLLTSCGPNREDEIRLVQEEYSALDCDSIRLEHELLGKMIEEENRSNVKTAAVNIAVGVISFLATRSGGFSIGNGDDKEAYKKALRLEALTNLVAECDSAEIQTGVNK